MFNTDAGSTPPKEWSNFDSSPTLRFERLPIVGKLYSRNEQQFPDNVQYGDIVKGLPIKRNSCQFVYSSHVLEHLSLADFDAALANTIAIMKPGGIFRFVLPDLEYSINKYVNDSGSDASVNFLKETLLGREYRPRGIAGLLKQWLGNSEHLWMWDFKSMVAELEKAGFSKIRRVQFDDSGNKLFDLVEEHQRWRNALGVSCERSE